MKKLPARLIFLVIFTLLLFVSARTYSFAQSSTDTPCGNPYPIDAPNLYQVSMSSTSATIYFVEPHSDFDSYSIFYGLTQDANSYSVTFNQGRVGSANKYTINDLYPKTTYYFKMAANNGCATGPLSLTVSSNPKKPVTLPVAGPGNVILGVGVGGILIFLTGIALLFII